MWLIKRNDKNSWDDAKLLSLYKETDDNFYVGILFERYAHLAFGVCMKYLKNEDDCKDAVLQIFENLLKDIKRFNIKNFGPWLHSVAKNHCLMILRKKQLIVNDQRGYQQAESTLLTIPDEIVFMNEEINNKHLENLTHAIEFLNDEQKKCIRLFYLEEKSYHQVSEITGYSLNSVKSFIQNGKRNLKNYLLKKVEHEN